MSTLALENEASVEAQIISVLSAGVLVAPPEDMSIEISTPNLGGYFRLELTDLDDSEIEDGRVIVKAAIDANARMVVTLCGESDTNGFQAADQTRARRAHDLTREAESR